MNSLLNSISFSSFPIIKTLVYFLEGIGVGLTRDTATLMVGQYFKRRRETVEIALVGASGVGLAIMTVFLHTTLTYDCLHI